MIKELKEVIKQYDSTLQAENIDYATKKEQYAKTYGNGEKYQEVMERATEAHRAVLDKAKQEYMAAVNKAYSEANKALSDYVTQPVPKGFTETLAAIKAIGKNLTPGEAALYYSKYADNYTARRALQAAGLNVDNKQDEVTRSLEAAQDALTQSQNLVNGFINSTPGSYRYSLLLTDNDNILDSYDSQITAFLGV